MPAPRTKLAGSLEVPHGKVICSTDPRAVTERLRCCRHGRGGAAAAASKAQEAREGLKTEARVREQLDAATKQAADQRERRRGRREVANGARHGRPPAQEMDGRFADHFLRVAFWALASCLAAFFLPAFFAAGLTTAFLRLPSSPPSRRPSPLSWPLSSRPSCRRPSWQPS